MRSFSPVISGPTPIWSEVRSVDRFEFLDRKIVLFGDTPQGVSRSNGMPGRPGRPTRVILDGWDGNVHWLRPPDESGRSSSTTRPMERAGGFRGKVCFGGSGMGTWFPGRDPGGPSGRVGLPDLPTVDAFTGGRLEAIGDAVFLRNLSTRMPLAGRWTGGTRRAATLCQLCFPEVASFGLDRPDRPFSGASRCIDVVVVFQSWLTDTSVRAAMVARVSFFPGEGQFDIVDPGDTGQPSSASGLTRSYWSRWVPLDHVDQSWG